MAERFTIAGAHVLVTGGSRGVGAAIAAEFAGRGARVTVVARGEEELAKAAAGIGAVAVPADLTDAAALAEVITRAEAEQGPVDALINNAAIAVVNRFTDQSPADVTTSFALNVIAPLELTRRVLPGMLQRGRGALVSISSLCSITAFPTLTTYGATKAALVHWSAALQRELRGKPVRMTVVQLGEVAGTDMMEQARRSPTIAAVSRRLGVIKALPAITAELVASRIADGVADGRRSVVVPGRVAGLHAIREFPSRLNDIMLLGID
jgi:uncharacterized protein